MVGCVDERLEKTNNLKYIDVDYDSFMYLTSFLSRSDLFAMSEANLDRLRANEALDRVVLECWGCDNVDERGKLYHCECGHSRRVF